MSRVLLVSLAMHRLLLNTVRPPVSVHRCCCMPTSAESSQTRHWLETRTRTFGVRPCMHTATSSWTFGSHPNIFWNIYTHSSRCFVSTACTLGCFVNSCLLLAVLLFHVSLGPNPWLSVNGSRVPIPGCFTFFTAIWRVFHSTKSNDFNANFSFGITAAVHFMKPTQFSRHGCHFPRTTGIVHNSVDVLILLHLLSELHHVVSTTRSTSCPSSTESLFSFLLAHGNRLCFFLNGDR